MLLDLKSKLLLDKRNRSNLPIGTSVPVTMSTRTFSLNLKILFLVSSPGQGGKIHLPNRTQTAIKKQKQITGVQTRTYSTKTKNNFGFRSRRPKVVEQECPNFFLKRTRFNEVNMHEG